MIIINILLALNSAFAEALEMRDEAKRRFPSLYWDN
jgi:hypothetical protein